MTQPTPSSDPTPTPTNPPAGGDPATNPPSSGEPPAGGTTPKPNEDAAKTFTQADLDRIIADRLKTEKAKFEDQLKQVQETAGKTELEAAQIERDRYKDQLTTTQQKAAESLVGTRGELAAHLAGAKPERIKNVVKEADLTAAIAEDGTVDEAKVKAAVEAVLAEFPEWKADRAPSSSGGELNPGNPSGKPSFTRQQIKDMSPEERAKRIEEINDALANGRVTG